MGAVDDPAVVGRVGVGLCSQLKTKVFDDIYPNISVTYIVSASMVVLQDGGRLRDCATLLRLTMTVLIPFPLPSIFDRRRSILYR